MADAVTITQKTIFVISDKGEKFRGVPSGPGTKIWRDEGRDRKSEK